MGFLLCHHLVSSFFYIYFFLSSLPCVFFFPSFPNCLFAVALERISCSLPAAGTLYRILCAGNFLDYFSLERRLFS